MSFSEGFFVFLARLAANTGLPDGVDNHYGCSNYLAGSFMPNNTGNRTYVLTKCGFAAYTPITLKLATHR